MDGVRFFFFSLLCWREEWEGDRWVGLPVEVDVEASTQVVRKSVDYDVEDRCGEYPFPSHRGEIRLALSTETDLSLGVFAAKLLA